jgi:hypothetical protein
VKLVDSKQFIHEFCKLPKEEFVWRCIKICAIGEISACPGMIKMIGKTDGFA